MFNNSIGSGLSIYKVLNGISKSLNIVNQILPIYKDIKPIVNNARTIIKNMTTTENIKNIENKKSSNLRNSAQLYSNNPTFFN